MKYLLLAAVAALPVAVSATGTTSPWTGRTLWVAANGLDSPTCGTQAAACRSIGQAITIASDGDTILVRPGLYGDLNGDGVLSGPGEETAHTFFGAIEINKRVRVLSTDGADTTIIDPNGAELSGVVVTIASGAQFGERGAGFTVTGGWREGVINFAETGVVIAGNTVRGIPQFPDPSVGVGMYINVGNSTGTGGFVEVRDNTLIGNPGTGLTMLAQNDTAYVSVHDNVISGGGLSDYSTGIAIGGSNPHLVYRNVVSDNGIGLVVAHGSARISNNVFTGNRDGVEIGGFADPAPARDPTFTRNTFSANKNYGLYVTVGNPVAHPTIHENNFYGNASNCGIASQSSQVIDARNNYWGAATGPSATEPADDACAFQGTLVTTPFATREFPVK